MKRNILLIVLCIGLILGMAVLTGCGNGSGVSEGENTAPEGPETISYDVVLYFVNQEYVTGDEDLPKLIEKGATIHVPEDSNPVIFMLKALSITPDEGLSTVVSGEIIFNDVYISDEDSETIVVDLGSQGLSGGSMTEGLFISQIVETLLHNTKLLGPDAGDLSKVQFLVEGKIVESLMGHIGAEEPFSKAE